MIHSLRMLLRVRARPRPPRSQLAEMTDALIAARHALLASRPLRPHQADLAAHLRAVAAIDVTLSGRDRAPDQGRSGVNATPDIALQDDVARDLALEQAKGFDGWIGHPRFD